MSEWAMKRFWKAAEAKDCDGGYTVVLDGRPIKTPAKAALVVPTLALAQQIAAEWDAQEDTVDPTRMPFTRSANAAIDKVGHQHGEVADMLAAYGDSDLLCYRATQPQELVDRQAAQWDPWLDWAAQEMGARLVPVAGVMHEAQAPAALERLSARVHAFDAFQMTAFHDLVAISGSLILGFAVSSGALDGASAWPVSRLDEAWQEEQWGVDAEAAEQSAHKRDAFLHAERFFQLSKAV